MDRAGTVQAVLGAGTGTETGEGAGARVKTRAVMQFSAALYVSKWVQTGERRQTAV